MNEVILFETLTPAVFASAAGIDAMLARIEADVRAVRTDISTVAGRKAVASLAYKIARSRSAFDGMGKDLVADWKKQAKAVDVERARVWDRLEALQAEVRKPLDDYEAAEAKRVADHESVIQSIIGLGLFFTCEPAPSAEVVAALVALDALPNRDWQEFKQPAATARAATFAKLTSLKEAALQREAAAAELERLRAEQAAREQQEREDRIAAEAAAKATRDAEAKAARQAQDAAEAAAEALRKSDQEQREATARALKAERDFAAAFAKTEQDKKDAAAEAERERLAAIEAERQRVADAAAADVAETTRREADKAHRKTINSEALAALVAAGLTIEQGVIAITAIVRGQIPHIKVVY